MHVGGDCAGALGLTMAKLKFSFPTLRQPPAVTFGRGSLRVVVDALSDHAGQGQGTVLFISAHPAVRAAFDAACSKRGVAAGQVRTCVKPAGEPTRAMIALGAAFLRAQPPSRLIALGGGSVLDWARLAWLDSLGQLPGSLAEVDAPPPPRPEMWLVPSTCATGAEAATVAVYSSDGQKVPVVDERFLADRVVLDAQFLEALDEASLARLLCDTLSHGIEAFVSLVPHDLAREFAAASLALVLEHFDDPPGGHRLEHLLEASYLAGLAASHCSVGVVHAWAHCLAGFGFAHAEANALGLLAGLRANAEAPALARLAHRLGCASTGDLAARVAPIVRRALPRCQVARLGEVLANAHERQSLLAHMAADTCLRTNPLKLGPADLERLIVHATTQPGEP